VQNLGDHTAEIASCVNLTTLRETWSRLRYTYLENESVFLDVRMHKLVKKMLSFYKAIFLHCSVKNFACYSWQF